MARGFPPAVSTAATRINRYRDGEPQTRRSAGVPRTFLTFRPKVQGNKSCPKRRPFPRAVFFFLQYRFANIEIG